MEAFSGELSFGFEDVAAFPALLAAAHRAARGKRKSRQVATFMMDLEPELFRLEAALENGTYRPRPFRTFSIRYPKPRTISAADFRDRVVHHALCARLEPLFEARSIEDSYACRKGRGGAKALARAQHWARRYRYVLRLDVRHFFESVSHDVLLARLHPLISDARVRNLVEVFIRHGAPGSRPGRGLPIGNLTSQHFGNFLLGLVDRRVTEDLGIPGYLRYLDDFVLFADAKAPLWAAHDAVREMLEKTLDLELKAEATRLTPVSEGIDFLGFRVFPHLIRFDGRRVRRFRKRYRTLYRGARTGEGGSEREASQLQGLLSWAAHAHARALQKSVLARLERSK